jgi:valyl-tRNA synthetase
VGTDKLYIEAPNVEINTEAQREQLEKDLIYFKGFLASVDKKLTNERFMQQAKPEIIAVEQNKRANALDKIKTLEESIALLEQA